MVVKLSRRSSAKNNLFIGSPVSRLPCPVISLITFHKVIGVITLYDNAFWGIFLVSKKDSLTAVSRYQMRDYPHLAADRARVKYF